MSQVRTSEFVESLAELAARRLRFIVSYDGRRGNQVYGNGMPSQLGLYHIELDAGRSAQSTLVGGKDITYESLYLSPALAQELKLDTNQK